MQVITVRPLTPEQAAAQAAWLLAGRDDEERAWRVLWEAMYPPPRPVHCTRCLASFTTSSPAPRCPECGNPA
jgi:hypothetical protein